MSKHKKNIIKMIFALCGAIFISTFYISKDGAITALAETNDKEFKWTKQTIENGTTVDSEYLWPDEINPSFTAIYRNGKLITDEMITITPGSVYHFRGISDKSVLYTEVYVGNISTIDVTSGETGTWYRLLPSAIRDDFEKNEWKWETGWEYTGRAYLDSENNRIMIKNDDHTAVLYGMGLYLDNKYGYANDAAFVQEGEIFKNNFGDTDNLFASALEYYYTRGGELRSICPKIYAMIADVVSQMDEETAEIRKNTINETTSEIQPEDSLSPEIMKDLLEYVNIQRNQYGLQPVAWDSADNDNIDTRVKEISILYSQIRPDGTDAFSAYTDAVKCEIRFENANTIQDIFNCASSYFLMENMKSFNCKVYENVGILIFVW